MADIACVFHWGLADLNSLEVGELMQWRERARQRMGDEPT
jgi:hypothetical protein